VKTPSSKSIPFGVNAADLNKSVKKKVEAMMSATKKSLVITTLKKEM
jgi:hypothetical protein